ncbi:aldo/keto reductase, partial [Candidatus Poribacteria bacterium]|nr:aldo/keto reductase [Candidatus Poribacteria bacterium]
MDCRNLGHAGIKVSPISVGTVFRGSPNDASCIATIERAIDHGINFIDCASTYQGGRSERLVGEVVRKRRRDQLVLSTKVCEPVGDGPNDRGLSRVHILREIDRSLRRLQTDYVDIYLLHHPDPSTPIEETLLALDEIVRQGKVRYIGCCNFAAWQLCKALWVSGGRDLTSFACVQNAYHLLDRSLEGAMMPLCGSEGVGIMAYSPLAVGLLTGRFRGGSPPPSDSYWGQRPERFAQAMTPDVDHAIATVLGICEARQKTPSQVALAWVLSHDEISTVITGPDTPEQVDENMGGIGWSLTA